jgi:hypothetical protein
MSALTTSETITILRARGRRLAKLVRPGAIESYDNARLVDLHQRDVPDLAALHDLLRALLHRPDCAVMRGAIRDPARPSGVRRLLHADASTGEAATLREVPRRWLALDLDNVPLPPDLAPTDLVGCAAVAVKLLPPAFTGIACIVQATASHGLKPGARLRLWFWCDRALAGTECKRWLARGPVDHSVFGAAQPIYTAAPVFTDGAVEHLPHRLLALPGRATVTTPDATALTPPPRSAAPPRPPHAGSPYAVAAMARTFARIASAPEGSRHDTAKAGAWGLARLVQAGLLTEAEAIRTIGRALANAGKDEAEGEALARWALSHRRDGTLPEGPRA